MVNKKVYSISLKTFSKLFKEPICNEKSVNFVTPAVLRNVRCAEEDEKQLANVVVYLLILGKRKRMFFLSC